MRFFEQMFGKKNKKTTEEERLFEELVLLPRSLIVSLFQYKWSLKMRNCVQK